MKKSTNAKEETRILEKTLDGLAVRRQAPKGVLVLFIIIYIASAVTISLTADTHKVVMFGGNQISLYTFAGVFSQVANLCIILMVVFCGKAGFIASIIMLLVQLPFLLMGIIVRGNFTSIPGIFGNALVVVVIIIIYFNQGKLKKNQARLREQATTDLLTGLPNGYASTEVVNDLIGRHKPFAVVAVDVNSFKTINDTMGFDMGNKVLVELARRWGNIADKGLSGTLDFIARINGDEFSLIIRDFDGEEEIEKTIGLYENALNEKVSIDGYDFVVNASFGYSIYPSDASDRDSLISCSVAAMKEIKRISSSEHILHYTPELRASHDQIALDNMVRDALDNDRVFFCLQPQFDMSHKLRGFEALARIKDADGKIISPDQFIPAAERMGLIDRIDLTVYQKAAEFFAGLIKQTDEPITLSINVSVKHMMKSSFLDEIRDLLASTGLKGEQLEIEITESILIESAQKAAVCLKELKNMGISIAIDDFGTGYSSLSYLNSFPSDVLKIDKSFIDRLLENDTSRKYVKAIIELAHVLDFKVVAEGVEEEEQLETLKNSGCDYIQGYIWGKPLPAEEAEKLVVQMADV